MTWWIFGGTVYSAMGLLYTIAISRELCALRRRVKQLEIAAILLLESATPLRDELPDDVSVVGHPQRRPH